MVGQFPGAMEQAFPQNSYVNICGSTVCRIQPKHPQGEEEAQSVVHLLSGVLAGKSS